MTDYREWIKHAPVEDIIGGSIPPRSDLDKMTYAEIGQMFGRQIVAAAKAVGIELTDTELTDTELTDTELTDTELTDTELTDIILTLFPVEQWPPFHPSHYDLHC